MSKLTLLTLLCLILSALVLLAGCSLRPDETCGARLPDGRFDDLALGTYDARYSRGDERFRGAATLTSDSTSEGREFVFDVEKPESRSSLDFETKGLQEAKPGDTLSLTIEVDRYRGTGPFLLARADSEEVEGVFAACLIKSDMLWGDLESKIVGGIRVQRDEQ